MEHEHARQLRYASMPQSLTPPFRANKVPPLDLQSAELVSRALDRDTCQDRFGRNMSVMLQESFCHIHHTWLNHDRALLSGGKATFV